MKVGNLDLFALYLSLFVGSTTLLKINVHKTVFKSGWKRLKKFSNHFEDRLFQSNLILNHKSKMFYKKCLLNNNKAS